MVQILQYNSIVKLVSNEVWQCTDVFLPTDVLMICLIQIWFYDNNTI